MFVFYVIIGVLVVIIVILIIAGIVGICFYIEKHKRTKSTQSTQSTSKLSIKLNPANQLIYFFKSQNLLRLLLIALVRVERVVKVKARYHHRDTRHNFLLNLSIFSMIFYLID